MSEDEDKKSGPLFLRPKEEEVPNQRNKLPKPPDMSWGDYILSTKTPLTERQKMAAHLVASGHANKEICAKLKYHPQVLSNMKSATKFKLAVAKFQERMFDRAMDERMKDLGSDAIDVIEEHITDDNLSASKRESTARWVIEKLTGKPAQQVDIKGEISVGVFLDELESLRAQGKIIDVSPAKVEGSTPETEAEPEPTDELADWVEKNT